MKESSQLAITLIRNLTEQISNFSLLYFEHSHNHYFLINSSHTLGADVPMFFTDEIVNRFDSKFPYIGLMITEERNIIPRYIRPRLMLKNGSINRV